MPTEQSSAPGEVAVGDGQRGIGPIMDLRARIWEMAKIGGARVACCRFL